MRGKNFKVVMMVTAFLIAVTVVVIFVLVNGTAGVSLTAPRSVHATPGNGFVTVY